MRHKFVLFIVVAIPLVMEVGMRVQVFPQEAHALSNPQTAGKNLAVKAVAAMTKVPANGQNCSVTIWNNSATPVWTGYTGVTTSTGIPLCTDSSTCMVSWLVRDTSPAAIYYGRTDAGAGTDSGVPIIIELGGGCVPSSTP